MQEGSLRADVNVSVRPQGSDALGTRCEIKNMNSMRFIVQAVEFEAKRQIALLEDGGTVEQETRLYDPGRGETRSMRSKEEAHDYRYFPDPDLLPLELDAGLDRRHRGEPAGAAGREEGAVRHRLRPARVRRRRADRRDGERRLLRGGGGGARRQAGRELGDQRAVRPAEQGGPRHRGQPGLARRSSAASIDLVASGEISGKIAKDVFEIVWTEGGDPAAIVAERGLRQVTDTGAIEAAVAEVIAANPDKAAQARAKPSMAGWFVGQVMKATGGKANPQAVNALVKAKLGIE